jgi:SAM-dependent methyltransferase
MHPAEYEKMFRVEATHWWFVGKRRLARVLLDALPSPLTPRRILDVGCGTGGMFLLLKEYGCAHGVDMSELALGFAAQRRLAQLSRAALPHLPFASETFDLVSAFDVLYHRRVADDHSALQEIARVLKPHAHLVLTDSALPFLRSAHDDTFHGARRYTTAEMSEKLRMAGFRIQRLSYANFFIFPAIALRRLMRRNVSADEGSDVHETPTWLNGLMGGVYRSEASLLKRVNLPIGSSIIALAEKNT